MRFTPAFGLSFASLRRFRTVAEAELTRFIKADLNADRFSLSVDDDAIAEAELFDGKLALITHAPNLAAAEAVARYKGLRTSSAASVS